MEKFKSLVLVLISLCLVGLTIYLHKLINSNKTLEHDLELTTSQLQFLKDHPTRTTDTVYLEPTQIQPPISLPHEVQPSKLILPVTNSNPSGISPELDSLASITSTSSRKDSITGINLNQGKFTLTFNNPLSGNHKAEYNILPSEYQYTWVDGKLTAKRLSTRKRLEIKPYTSLSYRPIHGLWDLEAGIAFKTKSFNYNLGLNGFYYPRWQKHPGLDAQIRITYNF